MDPVTHFAVQLNRNELEWDHHFSINEAFFAHTQVPSRCQTSGFAITNKDTIHFRCHSTINPADTLDAEVCWFDNAKCWCDAFDEVAESLQYPGYD